MGTKKESKKSRREVRDAVREAARDANQTRLLNAMNAGWLNEMKCSFDEIKKTIEQINWNEAKRYQLVRDLLMDFRAKLPEPKKKKPRKADGAKQQQPKESEL